MQCSILSRNRDHIQHPPGGALAPVQPHLPPPMRETLEVTRRGPQTWLPQLPEGHKPQGRVPHPARPGPSRHRNIDGSSDSSAPAANTSSSAFSVFIYKATGDGDEVNGGRGAPNTSSSAFSVFIHKATGDGGEVNGGRGRPGAHPSRLPIVPPNPTLQGPRGSPRAAPPLLTLWQVAVVAVLKAPSRIKVHHETGVIPKKIRIQCKSSTNAPKKVRIQCKNSTNV